MLQKEVMRVVGGRSVLCAVSGGADSVVLLHALKSCGIKVMAAHVEHGIRGESSLADCAFVQELCKNWDVELTLTHIDVPALAKASGSGIEETARQARYAFLREQQEKLGLDCIATAHHLNDQAETLLMHMVRGASPAGLAGMREENGTLIRPLLKVTREEIEEYARENRLEWVQDETNADTHYTRNFVRHVVLPDLQRINPQIVQALGRLSQTAAAQSDFIAQKVRELLDARMDGTTLQDISGEHEALKSAAAHEYLRRCGVQDVSTADTERLLELFDLQTGRRASIGKMLFERNAQGVQPVEEALEGVWTLKPGANDTPLGRFTLEMAEIPQNLNLGRDKQVLDADKVKGRIVVRTRRDGDRVKLLGSSGSKLVSDVLTDKKIPRAARNEVPIVQDEENIIWIAGIAPCTTCAIDSGSTRALIIHYEKNTMGQKEH